MQRQSKIRGSLGISLANGIAIALSCLYVGLRIHGIGRYGLWFDEVFSVRAAEMGWLGLVRFVAADLVHPPLFYGLLKIWIGMGGSSLHWLKTFPLMWSVLALVAFFDLCRVMRLEPLVRNIALFLVAVNGLLIYHAQEVRMYGLLLMLSIFSLACTLRCSVSPSRSSWLLLWAVDLLLVYTDYFGWLVVFVQVLFMLVTCRKAIAPALGGLGSLLIAYIPWVYAVGAAAATGRGNSNAGWIGRPGLADLASFFATLHGPIPFPHSTSVGIALFWAPLVIVAWHRDVLEAETRRSATLLFLSIVVPVSVAYVGSRVLPISVWGARQLITVVVPYVLLVLMAITRLAARRTRSTVLMLVVLWSGIAWAARGQDRLPWETLSQAIVEESVGPGSRITVYAFEEWVAEPLRFSLRGGGAGQVDIAVLKGLEENPLGSFWLAYRDTTWAGNLRPEAVLERRGCAIRRSIMVRDSAQRITMLWVKC